MKIRILLVCMVIAGILTSIGCKKGDTGPAGPAGAAGNANVQTYTYSVTSAQWVADAANLQWSVDYTLPAAAVLTGAVLLFIQDGSNWAALPHVDYGVTFEFGYDPTTKIIEVQSADAKAIKMIPNPGDMTFMVVTIPQLLMKTMSSVNLKNWPEVKKAFNLSN